jgi:uncharacterized membrane protein YkoI
MEVRRFVFLILAAVVSVAATCGPPRDEISRERAIAIARSQVSFTPDSIDLQRSTSADGPIWRVTLRGRLPGQPPDLFETAVVEIDARSGRVISVARP